MKINFTLSPKETESLLDIIDKTIDDISDVHLEYKTGTIDNIIVKDSVTIFMSCKEDFVVDMYTKLASSSKVFDSVMVLIRPIVEGWKGFFNEWGEPKDLLSNKGDKKIRPIEYDNE